LMHVIIGEKLYDADYVDRYTHGFDALRDRVATYVPERVASLTGIAVKISCSLRETTRRPVPRRSV